MRTLAARWLAGDERTIGLFLATGVLITAFFRLDTLRSALGVAAPPEVAAQPEVAALPEVPLALLLVVIALAWRSMLSRRFVWLEPAVLTWREVDRVARIAGRLTAGWVARLAALGYLLGLLAALYSLPPDWSVAGSATLVAGGLLALAVVRIPRRAPAAELAGIYALAAFAVAVRPGPAVLLGLAVVLGVAGVVLLARSGSPLRPSIATAAGRVELVGGWRERVVRTIGVSFLDVGLLLPAARPVRPRPLRPAPGLRLAWVGVLGRVRHVPAAVLLALTTVAVHLAFPRLPDLVLVLLIGYLAVAPFGAGLGDLWRTAGRRRWVGLSDTHLRVTSLLVVGGLAGCWAVLVLGLAAFAGAGPATGFDADVLLAVPVIAACVVRTATRKPTDYALTGEVATPMGVLPVGLIWQTIRGPDLGLLALIFLESVPAPGAVLVIAAVVALSVLR